eukprot:TRINITY_DN18737_c0_g1_i2.p1 TRINITY_DN18737_c0_g1~~TRINITY_DN18737_c0_g1_i2.p1  ORF type:complete len:371 (+),score=32.89 TRINITY_DN18737_c0_g1_i2:153-1265(+)
MHIPEEELFSIAEVKCSEYVPRWRTCCRPQGAVIKARTIKDNPGLTNQLVIVELQVGDVAVPPQFANCPDCGPPCLMENVPKKVLFRLNNTNQALVNRKTENVVMMLLHDYSHGANVYLNSEQYSCYDFIEGEVVCLQKFRQMAYGKCLMSSLSEWHTMRIPECLGSESKFASCMSEWCSELSPTSTFTSSSITQLKLESEGRDVVKAFEALNNTLVLGHNDANAGNCIVTELDGGLPKTIQLIDFEYAGPNFVGFDIGNCFCEHTFIDKDWDKYHPSETVQTELCRAYLGDKATEEGVLQLWRQAQIGVLASHLVWTAWSLLKLKDCEEDEVDFYEGYASSRWDAYIRKKEHYFEAVGLGSLLDRENKS